MPDTLRSCIIAEESYTFLSLDASQIELRVLAILSQDPAMLEDLKSGDLHQATADRMGCSRYDAKQGNFANVYGAGEETLAGLLECSIEEAREFMTDHENAYPVLYQWKRDTITQAKEDGYVISMFGRIRPLPELFAGSFGIREKAEKEVVNTLCQGTAVDIVKKAMLYLRGIFGGGIRLVLQVHDEIVWECPDEHLVWALEQCQGLKQAFPDYPFKVVTGKVYGEMNEDLG